MGQPLEGWSAIGEGWEAGDIGMDDILNNLKTVAGNFAGPVAIVLAMIWCLKVAVTLMSAGLMLVAQVADVPVLYSVAGFVGWLAVPAAMVVGLVQSSLYRPIQLQAFEGKEFVAGVGDVLRLSKDVIVKVLAASFLYGITIGIGSIACGVGMFVSLFFFCQAPYLAATTELGPVECLRRSYELNKAYYMPVLMALGVSLFIGGGLAGCGGAIFGAIGAALMQVSPGGGQLVAGLGGDLVGIVCGSIVLVVTGGLFTSIQSVERGVPFNR